MFKEALSSLASSAIGAAKATARAYIPTTENLHGSFDRIAQQGIANIAWRSPIMSDIANTMLRSFQAETVRKEQIRNHIKSESSVGLREAVSAKMGDSPSSKKVDAEMSKVLEKMSAAIDKDGAENAKKSSLFTEFGKHFSKFKLEPTQQPEPIYTSSIEAQQSGVDGSPSLIKIEHNTQRTFNVLEEMVGRQNLMGAGGNGGGNVSAPNSFIDPMTGMPSISAAVGSIGGSFLGKIFDNDTIEKFASKTKDFFSRAVGSKDDTEPLPLPEVGVVVPTTPETPKRAPRPRKKSMGLSSVESVLGDLSLDLNTDKNDKAVITKDNTTESAREGFTKVSTENISESAKEIEVTTNKRANELREVQDNILTELKTLNKTTEKQVEEKLKPSVDALEDKKNSLVDKAKDSIKEKVLSKVPKKDVIYNVGKMAGQGVSKALQAGKSAAAYAPKLLQAGIEGGSSLLTAGRALLPGAAAGGGLGTLAMGALAVGAAGLSGVAAGAGAVNPLIDKGLSKMTGSETSLGSWIYDKFNPEKEDINAPVSKEKLDAFRAEKLKNMPVPTQTKTGSAISAISSENTKQTTQAQNQASQPIIIAGGGNSGGNSSPPSIITTPTVRNPESTFERVQMQDFWPRMA